MLTTKDNPFSPITQYDQWLKWDHDNQYYTQEYVARIANVSPDMDDDAQDMLIESAINEILEFDTLDNYLIINK